MTRLKIEFETSYLVTVIGIGGLALLIGGTLASFGLRHGSGIAAGFGVLLAPVFLLYHLWSMAMAPGWIDETGIRRRDGRHFPWRELLAVADIRGRRTTGHGSLRVGVEARFRQGRVRVFPLVLRQGGAVLAELDRRLTASGGSPS